MTDSNNANKKETWFYKNPRKTVFMFILFLFLLIIFSAEKYLEYKNRDYLINQPQDRVQRFIRLREHIPLFNGTITPDDVAMKEADSLVRKEYIFRTDEDGFIMPSKRHAHPDINIFFLGGSTTECDVVEEENRFPYLAGKLLENKSGLKINSFNGGVSGNNSLHSIDILLNKVIPMDPHIVVMMHNINDLNILLLWKSYWAMSNTKSPLQVIVEQKPNYYVLLKTIRNYFIPNLYQRVVYIFSRKGNHEDEFSNFRGTKIDVNEEKIIKEFRSNLQTFIDVCKNREITPVLMTMANRFTGDRTKIIDEYFTHMEKDYYINRNEYKRLFDMFNKIIIEIGRMNNIVVIDLAKEIPPTKEFMFDVVHFNDKGSILAAEIISNNLIKLIDTSESR